MKQHLSFLSILIALSAFFVSSCTTPAEPSAVDPSAPEPLNTELADCTGVADGAYAPAYDGCNKCICQNGKAVSCTEKACNPPSALYQ